MARLIERTTDEAHSDSALHSYFLFVILNYGSLGNLTLPEVFLLNFSAWFSIEVSSYDWVVPLNLAKHAVACAFCLWYLPRFRKLQRFEL